MIVPTRMFRVLYPLNCLGTPLHVPLDYIKMKKIFVMVQVLSNMQAFKIINRKLLYSVWENVGFTIYLCHIIHRNL